MNALNIFCKTADYIFTYKNSERTQNSSQKKSHFYDLLVCKPASTMYDAGNVTAGSTAFSHNFHAKCFME